MVDHIFASAPSPGTPGLTEAQRERANVYSEMRHRALCGYRLGKEDHEIEESECTCGLPIDLDDYEAAIAAEARAPLAAWWQEVYDEAKDALVEALTRAEDAERKLEEHMRSHADD